MALFASLLDHSSKAQLYVQRDVTRLVTRRCQARRGKSAHPPRGIESNEDTPCQVCLTAYCCLKNVPPEEKAYRLASIVNQAFLGSRARAEQQCKMRTRLSQAGRVSFDSNRVSTPQTSATSFHNNTSKRAREKRNALRDRETTAIARDGRRKGNEALEWCPKIRNGTV